MTIRSIDSGTEWAALLGADGDGDVYSRWEFLEAWAREERATPRGLVFEHEDGRVVYPVLELLLDALEGGTGRRDFRTPYDFGGPLVDGPRPDSALARFETELRNFAAELGVVTEFARLHPLRPSAVPTDATLHADNFLIDLRLGDRELTTAQHPSHRRAVRAARKHELDFAFVAMPDPRTCEAWIALYGESMRRVGAPESYLFSDRLFRELVGLRGVRLASVTAGGGEILAAALTLDSGDDLFYYLGASTESGRAKRANNLLFDRLVAAGRTERRRYFHLGGGSPSLRRFKGQIATGTIPYYVLRRIHDPAGYQRLRASDPGDSGEFPAYLSRLQRKGAG